MNKSRMTNAERRMYFRHKRKLYRIEQRAAKRKNKVSGQFMNRVVICMILAAFIYTVVAIIVFVRVGAEPSTLTEFQSALPRGERHQFSPKSSLLS